SHPTINEARKQTKNKKLVYFIYLSVHRTSYCETVRCTLLSSAGIPHVAILSKIDEACPEIREDIKNVCHSRTLQQKIQLLSKLVGIPENCIFPIKNYHCEKKLNHETDALILNTLRSLIEIGEEYLSNGKRSNVLGGTVRKSIQDIRIRKKTAKLGERKHYNNKKTFLTHLLSIKLLKNNMCEMSGFLCFLSAGIHHVADLTKTDDTCSEISNETNVCRSQELQGDVQDLSPESCVYPEKNYDYDRSQSEPDEDVASREKRCWLLKERTGSRLSRTHLHWERPSKDWQGNWVRQQQLSDVQKKTKTDGNLPEPQTDSGVNMRINLILRRSADHSD
uniref:Uncharacterized protein n=1 Tax=Poecilia mexicana TaxID=48701 RepID=A0A3B3XLX1_9TELE